MISLTQIDDCIARIGQDDFATAFLAAVARIGAGQVMVFAYGADRVSCLLSQNFVQGRLGARLAADYLDHGFRDDPLRPRVLALPPRGVAIVALSEIRAAMPPAYRQRFFDAPGLADKVAVLASGASLRLIVNLYRADSTGPWPREGLTILARLAVLHFESRIAHPSPGGVPEPLLALSDRERAVCLGILAGQKAEEIAHDLGVAASSVVTYRKRAYAKLGLNTRAGLFAICRR